MLYLLVAYLRSLHNIPGLGVMKYISFRSSVTAVISMIATIYFCKKMITYFNKHKVCDPIRDLGLPGQAQKEIPSMGGLVILLVTLTTTLLLADITNVYVWLLMLTMTLSGALGFCDDYIKLYRHDKRGLSPMKKITVQLVIGCIVGLVMISHQGVHVKKISKYDYQKTITSCYDATDNISNELITSVPFLKNNELSYNKLFSFLGDKYYLLFIVLVTLIIVSTANAVNLSDGLDGLAIGLSIIVITVLCIIAYLTGHIDFASYLNILYIPNFSEISIFCSALIFSCIGFMWYNSYPAQIFLGDTGSMMLGTTIAVLAIIARKELLLPMVCGTFVIETLSVILQVTYFKYTKRKFGTGKRIFLMSPLHHHFQILNIPEPKIVTRFIIAGIICGILTLMTLKLQ